MSQTGEEYPHDYPLEKVGSESLTAVALFDDTRSKMCDAMCNALTDVQEDDSFEALLLEKAELMGTQFGDLFMAFCDTNEGNLNIAADDIAAIWFDDEKERAGLIAGLMGSRHHYITPKEKIRLNVAKLIEQADGDIVATMVELTDAYTERLLYDVRDFSQYVRTREQTRQRHAAIRREAGRFALNVAEVVIGGSVVVWLNRRFKS